MRDCRAEILQTVQSLCQEHLVLGTWGNVSTREDDFFWITPSGMPYDCLQAEDLIKVELTTGKAYGPWKPSRDGGSTQLSMRGGRLRCRSPYAQYLCHSFCVANQPIPT